MDGESSSKSKSNHKNKGKNGGSGHKYSKDGKKDYTQQKNNNFKKVYQCWVCGKPGHKAKDCRHKKEYGGGNSNGNSNQAIHVESPKEFAGVIQSFLTTNAVDWWFDTGLVLSDVLHVPNITKNMISRPILNNNGFKLVFESDKFLITKGGVYVGKGYLDEGLFKLSVITDDNVYKSNVEDISNNTIIESAEADLFENIFPHKDKEKQISNLRKRLMNDQLSQDEIDNNSKVPQENVEPRRSKRAKVTKDFGPDYMTYIVNEEPQTYKAAMESSEAPYWKEVIQGKIDSIVHNNTWKLVDLPSGHKPIGHKWIFKKKLRPDGTIEKYKARLVAKGYYDMLIMGTNMDVINQTKKMLHSSFDMKDMGEAGVILGIRIQKNFDGYILTQSHYIEKTLKKFGHYDDRPVVTLMIRFN
ncbi:retrotransposon protein, putative, ty1-copia subclass [Tanacetum coccineum]